MKEIMTPELLLKIKAVKETMKTDAEKIPGCDGLVLVKTGTEEYNKRKSDPFCMMFPVKEEGNDKVDFFISLS